MSCFPACAGRGISLLVALTAVLAIQSPGLAAPGQDVKIHQQTVDVALQTTGELRGQVLNAQGQPLSETKVAISQNQKLLGFVKTDAAGRFVVGDLKPGTYQVMAASGGRTVRVWAADSAPPAAQQAVLVVADPNIARAQDGDGKYGPAIRGAVAGGLLTGLSYWALDYNPSGS